MAPAEEVSIRMASDATDIGWDGHTIQGVLEHAREYFSKEENIESSTYRELLGVCRCLQATAVMCTGKFVVFKFDATNLMGIANRGNPRLKLNALARVLFWFKLEKPYHF